jgi:hypothetical protein
MPRIGLGLRLSDEPRKFTISFTQYGFLGLYSNIYVVVEFESYSGT